ncbi:MAG: helix-turn-helix domain-containing protein [Deltaproteobacteria bacterium]|nr:helix-turn-helix domain-containing protein [Deltaproteobacteria bacterium]MBW2138360.1 helix-turn-helix domain-containing protein [Deltaproteobacteria bacterium]
MEKLKDYMTIREAADFLGVSPDTLRRWDRSGKVKAIRHPVNRYRLYHKDELREVLRNLQEQVENPSKRGEVHLSGGTPGQGNKQKVSQKI